MKLKRDSVPFTAVMPHHAGDVLFLALAIKQTKSYLNGMIVSNWYHDIVKNISDEINLKGVDLLPMMRDGNKKTDEEIFLDTVSLLTENEKNSRFYYYCRPAREFWISHFHMIDQFAFAVGATIDAEKDLVSRRCLPKNWMPESIAPPYKILLHFEGGWPLKAYPENDQRKLIEMFYTNGFKLTMLTSRHVSAKEFQAVKYTNLADYKKLLLGHHIIIGMDSFPVHYAAFIKGSPAICLFGPTISKVSCGFKSKYYILLDNNMDCTHCGGVTKCPRNVRTECDNFSEPGSVFHATVAMLNEIYIEDKKACPMQEITL
jgi:hypothetical protein